MSDNQKINKFDFVPKIKNINDLLKENLQVSPEDVQEKFQEKMKKLETEAKEKETIAKASSLGIDYIDLKGFPVSIEALSSIPEEIARQIKTVCFYRGQNEVRLGITSMGEEIETIKREFEEKYSVKCVLNLISEESLNYAFKLYAKVPKFRKETKGIGITENDLEKLKGKIKTFRDLAQEIQNVSVTEILTLLIAASIKSRASDIHLESEEKELKMRFRIDGLLHNVASLPLSFRKKIFSRIKLLSNLKINIENKPQDGRFTIYLKDDRIDVRVSTIPTGYGESVVLRLLLASKTGFVFEEIGLRNEMLEILKKEILKPNGMIITTGPTGSGKTTTLYAILNKLNRPEVKIATLEDPIEYTLSGINQSQIDRSKNYTFATGLRSILRQDPDIILVGEIRDLETAEIAINSALTGHLVLSTLHTNDAAGTIPRFLALGSKPFLLAPALNIAIGQRLVRKICQSCKEEIFLDKESFEKAEKILSQISQKEILQKIDLKNLKFYQGKGCLACQNIGYLGRVGIFEFIPIDEEIEKLILSEKISEYEIKRKAKEKKMLTMVEDGVLKALEGITTVEEVFRVAG